MRGLLLCAAIVAVAGCSGKPAPLGPQPTVSYLGPQLSAEEIRQVMVGNTGTGSRTGTTAPLTMYVAPDGTLVTRTVDTRSSGRWRIDDDGHFCSTGAVVTTPGEVCQTVHKAGVGVALASPRSVQEMVFTPGKAL